MPFWCVCPYPEQHMRFRSGWHGCSSVLSDKLLGCEHFYYLADSNTLGCDNKKMMELICIQMQYFT